MTLSLDRIAELRTKRQTLVLQLEELRASEKFVRHAGATGAKGGHPSSWRQTVQSTENLIASIDKVLRPYDRPVKEKARKRPPVQVPDAFETLAAVPNTPNSDVRVSIRKRGATQLLDVRVWRRRADGEAVPTLKGVTVGAGDLVALGNAIAVARSRLWAED